MSFRNICTACGKCSKEHLTPCETCKLVYYCSEECQKKHAEKHKYDCPKFDFESNKVRIIDGLYIPFNIKLYESMFKGKKPEIIWKKLIVTLCEPYVNRFIYHEGNGNFVERYPDAAEYFKLKIITFAKLYILSKKKANFAKVERRLRRESELLEVETVIRKIENDLYIFRKVYHKDELYFEIAEMCSKEYVQSLKGYFRLKGFKEYLLKKKGAEFSCGREKFFTVPDEENKFYQKHTRFSVYFQAVPFDKRFKECSKCEDPYGAECDYLVDVICDEAFFLEKMYYFKNAKENLRKLGQAGIWDIHNNEGYKQVMEEIKK